MHHRVYKCDARTVRLVGRRTYTISCCRMCAVWNKLFSKLPVGGLYHADLLVANTFGVGAPQHRLSLHARGVHRGGESPLAKHDTCGSTGVDLPPPARHMHAGVAPMLCHTAPSHTCRRRTRIIRWIGWHPMASHHRITHCVADIGVPACWWPCPPSSCPLLSTKRVPSGCCGSVPAHTSQLAAYDEYAEHQTAMRVCVCGEGRTALSKLLGSTMPFIVDGRALSLNAAITAWPARRRAVADRVGPGGPTAGHTEQYTANLMPCRSAGWITRHA